MAKGKGVCGGTTRRARLEPFDGRPVSAQCGDACQQRAVSELSEQDARPVPSARAIAKPDGLIGLPLQFWVADHLLAMRDLERIHLRKGLRNRDAVNDDTRHPLTQMSLPFHSVDGHRRRVRKARTRTRSLAERPCPRTVCRRAGKDMTFWSPAGRTSVRMARKNHATDGEVIPMMNVNSRAARVTST